MVSIQIEGELCGSSPPRSKVPRPRTPQSPLLTLLSCSPIVLVVEGLNLKGLLNEVVPLEGELSKGPCRSWSLTKTARLRYQCKDRTGSLKLAPNKGDLKDLYKGVVQTIKRSRRSDDRPNQKLLGAAFSYGGGGPR